MTRTLRTTFLAVLLAIPVPLQAEENRMTANDRAQTTAPVPQVAEANGKPAAAPLAYPLTRTADLAETYFGESIADPYRWLENDVRTDPEVADWVERQNQVTRAYLDNLPQRQWFEERLKGLLNYERYGLPVKAGGRYFYTHNTGLQNQSPLYVRNGLRGKPRLLIDPNAWAKDSATALDDWKPSDDGRYLLYSVQDGEATGAC